MELCLSLGLCLVSFFAQEGKQLFLAQNSGAFQFRDLGVSMPVVPSQGWDVRYWKRFQTPFLPLSSCLWAEVQGPQRVRFWASSLPASSPRALHGRHKRVRILFLDLKEFCSCCSVVHTLGVSMVLLFIFPRARKASCPPAWRLWRKDGRSHSDREDENMKRISFCSHPDLGDKSTLLAVLKPEEVCLPQPTPAQFYIVQLK